MYLSSKHEKKTMRKKKTKKKIMKWLTNSNIMGKGQNVKRNMLKYSNYLLDGVSITIP